MASQIDVYNLAMTYLDISQTIQSVNDNTNNAGTCNRYYDFCRQYVLEMAHWDFATKTSALGLLLDQNTLSAGAQVYPGWRYLYQRPNDCLRAIAVTTMYGLRQNRYTRGWWYPPGNTPQWNQIRVPFQETLDYTNTANPGQSIDILCDQDSAWLVYTTDVTNVGLWSRHFMDCVAWHLAVRAAGPLSANQNAKKNAIEMANRSLASALAVSLNERRDDPYPDSPAIAARN